MSAFSKIAALVASAQQVQASRLLENQNTVCFSNEPRDMGEKNIAALISVIIFIVVIIGVVIYA